MNSYKFAILVSLVVVALLIVTPLVLAKEAAIAVDVTDNLKENAGTTPDSAFYGLKLGWEKVSLWFTFKQEKKAEKELALARKRLLEVRAMAEKGNVKAMQRAQEKHDELVTRAQERLGAIQEDSEEGRIKEGAKKIIGLEVALRAHQNRIEVLKDILAEKDFSDEARAAIESAVEKMENKTAAMEEKLEQRKDKIKTRLRAVTNKTEEEVEVEIKKLSNETGLENAKKAIAEHRVAKAEEVVAKVKERFSNEKREGFDTAVIEARIAEAEERITEAKALISSENYAEAIAAIKPVSNFGRNLSWIVRRVHQARIENRTEETRNLLEKAKEIKEAKLELKEKVSELKGKGEE